MMITKTIVAENYNYGCFCLSVELIVSHFHLHPHAFLLQAVPIL